jgi:hypothetical protein
MGHRAARRKLRIGKLRPRNVSTIIAVITGVLISLATYGVMFAFWTNFREALSKYTEVKAQAEKAATELEALQQELLRARNETQTKQQELEQSAERVESLKGQVEEVESRLRDTSLSLKETDALLRKKEQLRAELNRTVESLKVETKALEDRKQAAEIIAEAKSARAAEAELLVPKGAFLAYERIPAGQAGQVKALLQGALNRVNIRFARQGIAISDETAEAASKTLAEFNPSGANHALLLTAGSNLFKGDELLVAFEIIPLPILVHSGDVLMDFSISDEEATIRMAGLPDKTTRLPADFGPDQYGDLLLSAYDSFVEGMAKFGFLPQVPSGEWLTPFDDIAALRDGLINTERPLRVQIVSKQDADALDGLGECSIYIKSLAPEAEQASDSGAETGGPEGSPPAVPPVEPGPNDPEGEPGSERAGSSGSGAHR